ncbi:hypothetical protein L9F63_007799, partial [Diploptera punctata]
QQEQEKSEPKLNYYCSNMTQGCMKVEDEKEKIQQHEVSCEYQNMRCFNGCTWQGPLKKLSTHVRA